MINKITDIKSKTFQPAMPFRRKDKTVQEMSERHHEIARLLVLGQKPRDIAQRLSVSERNIWNVHSSPVVREQMAYLMGERDAETVDLAEKIKEALPECVEYLTQTISDADMNASLKSKNAFGLLAIGGHGATKNLNVRSVHAVLTAEDISEIRQQAEKIGISQGIIDAEYSEEPSNG